MGILDDIVPGDAVEIMGDLGVRVLYTPWSTGVQVAVQAIVEYGSADTVDAKDQRAEILRGIACLLTTDATAPDVRDLFSIDGLGFSVEAIPVRQMFVQYQIRTKREQRWSGAPSRIKR